MPARSRRLARRAAAIAMVAVVGTGLVGPAAVAAPAAPAVVAAPRSVASENYVRYVYEALLFRSVDAPALTYWTQIVDSGRQNDFVNTVVSSTEWRRRWVNVVYEELWLGRSADAAGRRYWSDRLAAGTRFDDMEIAIGTSAEAYARAGGTDRGYVDHVYQSVLNRLPTDLESDQGVDALARDGRVRFVASVLRSPAGLADRVAIAYDRTLQRSPDPGGQAYWSDYYRSTGRMARMLAVLVSSSEAFNRAQTPDAARARPSIGARH